MGEVGGWVGKGGERGIVGITPQVNESTIPTDLNSTDLGLNGYPQSNTHTTLLGGVIMSKVTALFTLPPHKPTLPYSCIVTLTLP